MAAGYSGTPLVRKLGIKPGYRVRFINAPPGLKNILGPLPKDVRVAAATRGAFDLIHLFARSRADLERRVDRAVEALDRDGSLWISWPKKTSALAGDLSGNAVRSIGLDRGLVDVKVCAVDDDWSGLKFMYRRKDR